MVVEVVVVLVVVLGCLGGSTSDKENREQVSALCWSGEACNKELHHLPLSLSLSLLTTKEIFSIKIFIIYHSE